jgi:hypothetical protein
MVIMSIRFEKNKPPFVSCPVQIVTKYQGILSFCKKNMAFCLRFSIKVVPLHAQIVKTAKSEIVKYKDESTD